MVKKIKSNNGFTLIELVIALAMLAFIMTAVSSLMGSSIFTFRKSKADINVQNQAQSVYDKISDSVMQAKRLVIFGYESTSAVDFGSGVKSGDEATGSFAAYYYVATKAEKDALVAKSITNVKLFKEVSPSTKIYVISIIADAAIPIEQPGAIVGLNGADHAKVVDTFTNSEVNLEKITSAGVTYWNTNDTVRNRFIFNGKNLYYEREYALQSARNDSFTRDASNERQKYDFPASATDDDLKIYKYTDTFKWLEGQNGSEYFSLSGCIATVDYENGAIGFEMYFDDKDRSYTTDGMVKLRNSDVLKDR